MHMLLSYFHAHLLQSSNAMLKKQCVEDFDITTWCDEKKYTKHMKLKPTISEWKIFMVHPSCLHERLTHNLFVNLRNIASLHSVMMKSTQRRDLESVVERGKRDYDACYGASFPLLCALVASLPLVVQFYWFVKKTLRRTLCCHNKV